MVFSPLSAKTTDWGVSSSGLTLRFIHTSVGPGDDRELIVHSGVVSESYMSTRCMVPYSYQYDGIITSFPRPMYGHVYEYKYS